MVLTSRFCLPFDGSTVPLHVHRSLKPDQITENINFSVEYWQPFIDQKGNTSAIICGPLLGILVELANKISANLTFVPDVTDEILPFFEIENGTVQVVLTPFAPMSLDDKNVQKFIKFSTIIGDMPMISILSGKQELSLDFEAMSLFNYAFFYLYFLFFFIINFFSLLTLSWTNYISCNILPNSFRIFFKQPITHKTPFNLSHLLLINLFLLTGFFHLLFSTKLLAFFTFSAPFQKVDNLNELLQEEEMKICLFEGETSVQVFEDEKYAKYKSRTFRENPPNDKAGHWEDSISDQINQRTVALISDKYYLDYIFNNHALKYPNLYRSTSNELILPYFLPLSYRNKPELNAALNSIISTLRQSGIYEFWLRETVLANNPTKKRGVYIDPNKQTFDYDRLTLTDCRLLFYLFAICQCMSCLLFLGELAYSRAKVYPFDRRCGS